jgi:Tfp pilus assembly protein PilN
VRPINLIPPEQRRGEQSQLRSGPLAYLLLGGLVAVLVGVTALVLTGNQIDDRKAEAASLEAEDAAEAARAERLAPFVEFRDLREARLTTIADLADSRFDWERVMRELALILPNDAWLTKLTGTASPEARVGESGGTGGLRSSAPGPALQLTGCATGQKAVAGFVGALKDIEGVTRVGVESSELPTKKENGGVEAAADSGDECRTRAFIAKFEIVVAFDAAPVVETTSPLEGAPPPTEQAASDESDSGETEEAG